MFFPTSSTSHRSLVSMISVRREYGHCRIGWTQSTDTDSFKLSRGPAGYNGATGPSPCEADAAIILEGNNQVRMEHILLSES